MSYEDIRRARFRRRVAPRAPSPAGRELVRSSMDGERAAREARDRAGAMLDRAGPKGAQAEMPGGAWRMGGATA